MEPIAVPVGDGTILVPRLKVQQIIDLAALRHEAERRELVQDLEDAGVTSEDRLERLRAHRKEVGLSSVIVRSAFSIDGAYRIIKYAMGGEFPSELDSLDPSNLSKLALACIGVDLDDLTEGGAEGKERTSVETGSASLP